MMIKQLKNLVKMCEGLMWLYLPVVIIYWSLTLIELNAIAPLKAFLGVIVVPFASVLDDYFDFQFSFAGTDVDYTPLILAVLIAGSTFLLILTTKILDFIEERMEQTKIEMLRHKEKKQKEIEKENLIQDLDRHKVIYLLLKLEKIKKHETYLVNSEQDAFSVGLVDSYEATIKDIANTFGGKKYRQSDTADDINNYVFTGSEQYLLYLLYLKEKIKEINKGTQDDLNTVFTYKIACSCSYDIATAETDIYLTNKMMNLVAEEEILITSTLKDKLQHLNTDVTMAFESKGYYILDDKDFDVYKLKLV